MRHSLLLNRLFKLILILVKFVLIDASDEDFIRLEQLLIFELRFARVLVLYNVNLVLYYYWLVIDLLLLNSGQTVMLLVVLAIVVVYIVQTIAISLLNRGQRAN